MAAVHDGTVDVGVVVTVSVFVARSWRLAVSSTISDRDLKFPDGRLTGVIIDVMIVEPSAFTVACKTETEVWVTVDVVLGVGGPRHLQTSEIDEGLSPARALGVDKAACRFGNAGVEGAQVVIVTSSAVMVAVVGTAVSVVS